MRQKLSEIRQTVIYPVFSSILLSNLACINQPNQGQNVMISGRGSWRMVEFLSFSLDHGQTTAPGVFER